MKVALHDTAFQHVAYSVPGRVSRHIEWVRFTRDASLPAVITDDMLRPHILERVFGSKRIGWLLEGRAYGARNYAAIPSVIDSLDLLLTHDAYLLEQYPQKARFVPFGGCWIPDSEWGIKPKSREVSHIYSAKRFMAGHEMRHQIAQRFPLLDHYGHGTPNPVRCKSEALADYRFSIVVENDRAENYFTEKLIDCLALGTVPIYWGCPNIADFFDPHGIIQFDNINDLDRILPNLHCSWRLNAIMRNHNLAREYVLPEDYMYEHYLKEFDK